MILFEKNKKKGNSFKILKDAVSEEIPLSLHNIKRATINGHYSK